MAGNKAVVMMLKINIHISLTLMHKTTLYL